MKYLYCIFISILFINNPDGWAVEPQQLPEKAELDYSEAESNNKIIIKNREEKDIEYYLLDYNYLEYNRYLLHGEGNVLDMRYGIFKPGNSNLYSILLKPNSSVEFYPRSKSDVNVKDKIQLFEKHSFDYSTVINHKDYINEIIWQSVFFGILLFQLIYTLLQWSYLRKDDYLYYIAYMLVIGIYFLSKYEYLFPFDLIFSKNPEWWIYLDKSLPLLSYYFYYRFARSFLNLPVTMPGLNRHVRYFEYFLLGFVVLDFIFISTTLNTHLEDKVFSFVSIFLTAFTFYAIIRFAASGNILSWFILSGAAFVTIGSFASFLFFVSHQQEIIAGLNPLFANQAGIILELFAFTTGLAYKSQLIEKEKIIAEERLKHELEVKEIERVNTIKETEHRERARIARDLHDDLGSGLSSIKMLSEVAKLKNKSNVTEEIRKISTTAGELLDNIRDIVWIMNSGDEKLYDLIMRMRNYALEYFETSGIECKTSVNHIFPVINISDLQKRNLYFSFKECLHNIVKHSCAQNVAISFDYNNHQLEINIEDDGIGMKKPITNKGNGLNNISKRMIIINGNASFVTATGTKVLLACPLELNVSKGTLKI